jgi:hypothetical protein
MPLRADWKDDVGYTRLLQTFTSSVPPSSVSAGVTQVEANDDNGNNYLPDSTQSVFSGKTIYNLGSGSGTSEHATTVGSYFYGNAASLVPATTLIDAYSAKTWASLIPYAETRLVQNHSWIGTGFADGTDINSAVAAYNVRVDYMANNYGTVVVAGVNNGYSTTLPYLLCQGYNLISVGLTNGQHSAGLTAYDGTGRIKPDIVAPDSVTSFSTPQVSSAAGLLAEKLTATPYSLTGANIPRVVKSLLLTGATKDEFTGWSRTDTQPIDTRYGAGELNILLAYRTLLAGPVSASGSATVADTAWTSSSLRNTTNINSRTFFFDLPAGTTSSPFAATLVWHRAVSYSGFTGFLPSLANLDLALYSVTADTFTIGATLQTSASTVDNVEHIYVAELPPGRYALRVSTDTSTSTAYALAWRTSPTVTVAATSPTARESDGTAGMFTATRTGPTTSPLLVPLNWGGSAVSGTHYTPPPATLLIPAGSSSASVQITPVSDSLAQGDRSVTLYVSTDYSLSAGASSNATVTIQDKPYDAWRFARFTTAELADDAISGPSADPDADGLPNLLEYSLNAEPTTSDATLHEPVVTNVADHLTLTYTRPTVISDITYAVEWSGDLQSWSSDSEAIESMATTDNGDGTTTVVVRAVSDLSTTPRQFLRLRATRT